MEDSRKETEWWWIDFLENELEPSLKADLELLLEHSQEDRDSFESIRLLKQWVGESDPVGDWPVDARLDRIRRKVMQAIDHEIQEPLATNSLRT